MAIREDAVFGVLQCIGADAAKAGAAGAGLLLTRGTNTYPVRTARADTNFIDFRMKSQATSGTARGQYLKTYLSSGAGGETVRAYTVVENNTPADTCNGAHISLDFGSSAGNITGLGTAVRATLHVPNRSLGGTTAAVMAEVYSAGTSSAFGGVTSFVRMVNDGDSTGKAAFDTSGYLLDIQGLTANTNKLFRVAAPSTLAASLRCRIGSTTYYLPLYSAAA